MIIEERKREKLISFSLRAGLAIVFLYASISAFLNPLAWVGFFPQFIKTIISITILLNIHSIANILLAIWLLSNKKIFYAATLSALELFVIVIFNISSLDIIFRDIAVFFSAIALAVLSYNKN